MADGGRGLPKWQTKANPVPNAFVANGVPQKNNFFTDFFYLQFKFMNVEYRYKSKRK